MHRAGWSASSGTRASTCAATGHSRSRSPAGHGVGKTTVALLLVCKAGRRAFFANPEDDSAALLAMARRLDPRRDTLIIDDADANPKACQELLRRYRCAVVTAAKLPDALRAIPSVKLPALPPEVVQAAMQQCRPAISERACARVWAQARGDFRLAMTTVELGTYFSEIDHRDADDKAPLPTLAARIVDSSLPWADRAHAAQVAAGAEHLVHAGYVPRDAETLETWARRFSDIDVGAPAVALATHPGRALPHDRARTEAQAVGRAAVRVPLLKLQRLAYGRQLRALAAARGQTPTAARPRRSRSSRCASCFCVMPFACRARSSARASTGGGGGGRRLRLGRTAGCAAACWGRVGAPRRPGGAIWPLVHDLRFPVLVGEHHGDFWMPRK